VKRVSVLICSFLAAILFIAGCATQTKVSDQKSIETTFWHGRLSMQVEALPDDTTSQRQSLSASFELRGDPESGELQLFTPLGSTAAAIRWTSQGATLNARGETRTFASLDELTQQVLGASVPAPALFAWLRGQDLAAAGWTVELSQFAQGQLTAQRVSPLPQARLRLILEP
jgi:outer membrane lipoprotein LolB